ncbi:MAG: hypothetical protein RI580_08350 [Halothece sp. Uz-M2-17]|nr:hypothetical protein [Halothece sp. Uz-M2-17]
MKRFSISLGVLLLSSVISPPAQACDRSHRLLINAETINESLASEVYLLEISVYEWGDPRVSIQTDVDDFALPIPTSEETCLENSAAIAQLSGIIVSLPNNLDSDITPELTAQSVNASDEIPWRFILEPYIYLPLETTGDITVRNTEVPVDFSLGDILETLTFALYGRFEGWKGHWGFIIDAYHFNSVDSDSTRVDTPPALQGVLPAQITIEATAETAFTKLDLAAGYRFGNEGLTDAFQTAKTDFELGPFIFDAIAGLRFYFVNNDLELTSNIGQEFNFSGSNTLVEPMIGGRARWNLSDNLGVLAVANFSGFGIGTNISIESYAGIDWLFSGNTSMTATYRLTYINYDEDDSGLDIFQHGPALGVKFRF